MPVFWFFGFFWLFIVVSNLFRTAYVGCLDAISFAAFFVNGRNIISHLLICCRISHIPSCVFHRTHFVSSCHFSSFFLVSKTVCKIARLYNQVIFCVL